MIYTKTFNTIKGLIVESYIEGDKKPYMREVKSTDYRTIFEILRDRLPNKTYVCEDKIFVKTEDGEVVFYFDISDGRLMDIK